MIHSILCVQIMCFAASLYVLFGSLCLEPSTSYSIHFFTQSVSSFRSACPYRHNLFRCSINIISFVPRISQRANEQMIKFWWRSGSGIPICIATLVRRTLVEVCTVPVLLVVIVGGMHCPSAFSCYYV